MEKFLKQKKGITLIALVITIIVLLILAGISISMLSGDNGILQKATDAKELTGVGQEKETIALAYNSALAKKVSNGDSSEVTAGDLNTELTNQGATANGDDPITVIFDSGNIYTINIDGNIEKKIVADRTGLKIGDYVTYAPAKSSVNLSKDETGYTSNQTIVSKNKFRIMNINNDGSIDLLGVIESSDGIVHFKGAQGYNNGVHTLNAKCNELYARNGITARNLNFEDITSKFNSIGNEKITSDINARLRNLSFSVNKDTTNNTATYPRYVSYYPNIFQYEQGGKLESVITLGTIKQSDSYNGYGSDGILTNADKDESGNVIPQYSQTNALTVPNTYSSTLHETDDFLDSINKTAYYSMFFERGTDYWLASRSISPASDRAYFQLRSVSNSTLDGRTLFSKDIGTHNYSRIAPVISIGSNIQIEKNLKDGTEDKPYTILIEE